LRNDAMVMVVAHCCGRGDKGFRLEKPNGGAKMKLRKGAPRNIT